MTSTAYVPRVHLAGSIPLENSEAALRTAATLGSSLARIPDGETGERSQVFVRLRSEGVIPDDTRFQVSLPTPVGFAVNFFEPAARPLVEGPYQTTLSAELDTILAAIPGPDLAIQWDVVWEFAMIERWSSEAERWGEDAFADIVETVADLGNAVRPTSSSDFTSAMATPTTSTSPSPPTPGDARCRQRHPADTASSGYIFRFRGAGTTSTTSPPCQNWTSTKTPNSISASYPSRTGFPAPTGASRLQGR